MSKMRSFSLLELVIVIVIVGILATLGIYPYISSRERALGDEARVNLQLIAAAERVWKMESATNAYTACSCLCAGNAVTCCNELAAGCNIFLRLSLNTQNWTYTVTGVAGTGAAAVFTATATRTGGTQVGNTITLTEADVPGGTFTF